MILYRWQGVSTNFGDELNTILWPRLLPDFFDGNPAIRFLGIGSVLDRRHAAQPIKLVAGSGYGGYEDKPRLDKNWIIHWVRGPRTAAALGLPTTLALGDPAVLVPQALGLKATEGQDIGFMPHFESANWGAWQRAADRARVRLIDPRAPPLGILQAISGCRLLMSEALHGVIIADALRVPWIAIQPLARVHRPKWLDWAETMDLHPRFGALPASTLFEWASTSRLRSFHTTRVWLRHQEHRLKALSSERLVARASQALCLAAQAPPQLSSAVALDRCQSRMLDAVQAVRANPMSGSPSVQTLAAFPSGPLAQSCLQASGNSAYQLKSIG